MNTNYQGTSTAGRPGMRHSSGKEANMVFFDGHAEPLTLKELQLKPGDLSNQYDVSPSVSIPPGIGGGGRQTPG